MKIAKRAVAALALLLGVAALLLSLAVGAGVWVVKGPVTDRATRLFGRVEAALDLADKGLDHAASSLATAGERLEGARQQQQEISRQPQRGAAMRRTLARTVQQRVVPEISNANEKLHAVAEAAVVVNSVLEDLGNFPLLGSAGLDLAQLNEINSRIAGVGPAAWDLSRLLGESAPDSDASAQLSRIDQALKQLASLIGEYKVRVAEARSRTEGLRSRVFTWVTPAAALISFAGLWVALSQVSVLFHAWSLWARAGLAAPQRPPLAGGPS